MTTWDYTDNGLDTDPLIINSITATPAKPQPGSPWKLAIKATALEVITEGAWLDVTLKLGLIKLHQKRYDLFGCLGGKHPEIPLTLDGKEVGPIEKGNVDMTLALDLKREIPRPSSRSWSVATPSTKRICSASTPQSTSRPAEITPGRPRTR